MEYIRTHNWLAFTLNLTTQCRPRFWMALGEAQSKCMHIAGVPLLPETQKKLYKVYLAKGVHATTAIEGNSLSENEVLQQIEIEKERQPQLPLSQAYLKQEVRNIIDECNKIKDQINREDFGVLTRTKIEEYNRQILRNLPLPEEVAPGEIRKHSVVVSNYRGAPAQECGYLLEKLCEWLNGPDFRAPEQERIAFGILKAIISHVYLAWIHPFGDGNGRTARLVEFYILMSSGVPAPASQLLSNHYNRTRSQYYRHLDETSKSGGNLIPFIEYAVQGFIDGLHEQLNQIKRQQMEVTWRSFVHESFKGKHGLTSDRQRDLVLDLTRAPAPVPLGKIREVSPRMAAAYARKTTKTIQRDVNAIRKMEPPLILQMAEGIIPNTSIIWAFLPPRHIWGGAEKQ